MAVVAYPDNFEKMINLVVRFNDNFRRLKHAQEKLNKEIHNLSYKKEKNSNAMNWQVNGAFKKEKKD